MMIRKFTYARKLLKIHVILIENCIIYFIILTNEFSSNNARS